jgi:hypothetical protein
MAQSCNRSGRVDQVEPAGFCHFQKNAQVGQVLMS